MKKRLLSLTFASLAVLTLAGCGKSSTGYSNEKTPIIFSSQELDGVFNPFFSTSAADSKVISLTQISMLSNDAEGNISYGEDEPVVVLDYETITEGVEGKDQTTTYNFVLKNNIKFSNGSPLTIKDVLFNLYVYLDPVYTGSSTIYSTDIVGLQEYRTQAASEDEQESFTEQFQIIADTRMEYLINASNEIFDDNKNETFTIDTFKSELEEYTSRKGFENVLVDFTKACELFKEELETDYTNAKDTASGMTFTDSNNIKHSGLLTTDVEAFLYNEGYITFNKKDAKLESSLTNNVAELKNWTKEMAIDTIYNDKIPNDIVEVVSYWNTAVKLNEYLYNQALSDYNSNTSDRLFPNISGIKFANKDSEITVNKKKYIAPTYASDGSINNNSNEVLSITINDVDPKAIWNFAFAVAPMYYYSDNAHIDAFDFESNFGVEYSSSDFMNNVLNAKSKVGVPVGAGPYQASKSSGGTENVGAGDFLEKNVVYYERNEYYIMGAPKIKRLVYQVVSSSEMMTNLYNNQIDFAEPNAKYETIQELDGKIKSGANYNYKTSETSGYGYIGINAGKVPDIKVRQAIMHSMNTSLCIDYYKNQAKQVFRSMSLASWAYPKGATAYYPYIGAPVPEDLSVVNPDYADYVTGLGKKTGDTLTETEQKNFIKMLVEDSGYTLGGNGVYVKGNNVLKYTFTIAGSETDHPAWQTLFQSSELLNKVGFEITVSTDAQALSKLASGALTVWAAAWSSTIDPDMYQVYHMDSKATSTNNWGYKQIKQNTGGKYATELSIIEELSELIDNGRKTNDKDERTEIYAAALDLVMELAVELPTYQRNDLYVYNTDKIDETTLNQNITSYSGLTDKLWQISLNETK
ncbi:MAG: ABC transporter substrate-binding protein [Anaeroplasma sp.]